MAAFFYIIGKFFELAYDIKKPSGQDRPAAEGNYVANATRRRRRILLRRILFHISEKFSELSDIINAPLWMRTWRRQN